MNLTASYSCPPVSGFSPASPPELLRCNTFTYPTPEILCHDKMSVVSVAHPNAPLSPPESPASSYARLESRDALLLSHEGALISLDTPLFHVSEQFEPLVIEAISSTEHDRKLPARAKPTTEEYNTFVSSAWRLYKSNPRAWLRQEKTYSAQYSDKVAKLVTARKARVNQPRKTLRTPKTRTITNFQYPSPSPYESRPKISTTSREDSDFESLVDLTPPLSTLVNAHCLQVEWKGTPLPIEHELHFDLLHPAEQKLASTLRLTPAIYLSSKRRIFIEKVERTRRGKEFRKTDSQKACKIDVNKASKLWTVFDKVGWFDRKYIDAHL